MLEILFAAYHSDRGVVINTPNPTQWRQEAYKVRAAHEELSILTFHLNPTNPEELFIAKVAREPTTNDD